MTGSLNSCHLLAWTQSTVDVWLLQSRGTAALLSLPASAFLAPLYIFVFVVLNSIYPPPPPPPPPLELPQPPCGWTTGKEGQASDKGRLCGHGERETDCCSEGQRPHEEESTGAGKTAGKILRRNHGQFIPTLIASSAASVEFFKAFPGLDVCCSLPAQQLLGALADSTLLSVCLSLSLISSVCLFALLGWKCL